MKTAVKEKKITEYILTEENELSPWLRQFLFAALSFSLSQLKNLGGISPFCAAFLSSVKFEYCLSSLIGGACGYFFAFDWKTALKYSAVLILCACCRTILQKKLPYADTGKSYPLTALLSCLSVSALNLAFGSFGLLEMLLAVCEALTAFCAAYLYLRVSKTPVSGIGLANLPVRDTVSIGLCVAALLLCACGFSLGPIAPAHIIAVLFLLFVSHYKGAGLSCLFGVCISAVISVAGKSSALFPPLALGSLACGVFASLGQYAVSLSFAVTASVTMFVTGFSEKSFWCLLEIGAACAIFAAIPSRLLFAAHGELEKSFLLPDCELNRRVSASLKRAADTVDEVSDIVKSVSAKLDNVINPEVDRVFAKFQQSICFGCSFKAECWSERFGETASDILSLAGLREKTCEITELEKRCPRSDALVSRIKQSYGEFVDTLAAKTKVKEVRSLISDQFSSIAGFLSELSQQVSNSRVVDNTRSRALKTALSDAGIYTDSLSFFTDPNGRITVEVSVLENAFELDFKKAKLILETATKRHFERPEIAIMDLRSVVTFEEKASYRVLVGTAQQPFRNNKVCGDCIGRLRDLSGNEIALISDGMGTGSRAAVDGTMAATLMEKLLSCSFSFESALKTVNCALMVKSTDESIATIDGVSINIYSGETDFYKAGAAVSFVRRGNEIALVEEQSLPIGIIRDICFAHKRTRLQSGDIVLLVSDGVTAGDCGWVNDELLAWSTNKMNDLASHIASLAKLRSSKDNEDDITVVALKVLDNN